jgi:hypothetical protein
MGSTRLNAKGEEETLASDLQPGGYHNAGQEVQNLGAMLWDGAGWVPAGQAVTSFAATQADGIAKVSPQVLNGIEGEFAPLGAALGTSDGGEGRNTLSVAPKLSNSGGTYDRQRNNSDQIIALESAVRTATTESPTQVNYNHSKLYVRLSVTTAGTGTLRLNVNSMNIIIASFAPFKPVAPSSTSFLIAPGLANVAGAATFPAEGEPPVVRLATVNAFVGRAFWFTISHSDSSSWTYSLLYALVL